MSWPQPSQNFIARTNRAAPFSLVDLDPLFVAGRVVNDNGKADVLWVPGQNR